jgi:glutamate/tyrosine decarboxylase-like PLP-dependent enzyme
MTTNDTERLRRRKAPLSLDADTFRSIGHRLVDRIAEGLAAIPEGPVTRDETAAALQALIGSDRPLPAAGADPAALVGDAADLLFEHSLFNGHPRFFGYITSSPAPIGMLGDFLAAAINQNVGAWRLAPLATEIERQTVRWIAEVIGFPTSCGGLLVSGGNAANFLCVLAARAAKLPWNVRSGGLAPGAGEPRLYATAETHTWIQKAADLFGFGTDAIHIVETDREQRMDPAMLQRRIDEDVQEGLLPFLVVATAGSVSTGVVDPLFDIASICRERGLWFHVDGAYGALAARVTGAPGALEALSEADSIAVDPHKWLYAPLEAGCALVRDERALRHAFSYHPAYYHFDPSVVNYIDYGPQNSRGFRALKVWLALRQAGREGYLQMIGDDIALARHLHDLVSVHPELEAASHNLSITTFRYIPADLRGQRGDARVEEYLNQLNEQILSAMEKSGEAFLSNARVGTSFLLRACIVNFHTSLEDIEAVAPLVCAHGRTIDATLRAAAPIVSELS